MGCCGQVDLSRDGKGLDSAGPHLWQSIGRARDHHVDLPGRQILQGRCDTTVGHELKAGAGDILKNNALDVPSATDALGPQRCLVGVCKAVAVTMGHEPTTRTLVTQMARSRLGS